MAKAVGPASNTSVWTNTAKARGAMDFKHFASRVTTLPHGSGARITLIRLGSPTAKRN